MSNHQHNTKHMSTASDAIHQYRHDNLPYNSNHIHHNAANHIVDVATDNNTQNSAHTTSYCHIDNIADGNDAQMRHNNGANTPATANIKSILAWIKTLHIPAHLAKQWLLHVLDKNFSFLIMHEDYVLSDDNYALFLDGIQKMQQHTPLAYLTGQQDFYGHTFLVNAHTLIPRPDTECLLDFVLQFCQKFTPKQTIDLLDLGTGTGCIAISACLSLHQKYAVCVDAIDISQNALLVAKQNAKNLGADINFLHSNWFSALDNTKKYDIIIANPPYIAKNDAHLAKLMHEPKSALVSDNVQQNDGLADILHIITHARQHLNKNGLLIIEHGHTQSKAVVQWFKKVGFNHINTISDYGGNTRACTGLWMMDA